MPVLDFQKVLVIHYYRKRIELDSYNTKYRPQNFMEFMDNFEPGLVNNCMMLCLF